MSPGLAASKNGSISFTMAAASWVMPWLTAQYIEDGICRRCELEGKKKIYIYTYIYIHI
jgi:hypothetical protein